MSKAPPAKQEKNTPQPRRPVAAIGEATWGGLNAPNLPATAIPFFKISLGAKVSEAPPAKQERKNTPQPRRPVAAIGGATHGAG